MVESTKEDPSSATKLEEETNGKVDESNEQSDPTHPQTMEESQSAAQKPQDDVDKEDAKESDKDLSESQPN